MGLIKTGSSKVLTEGKDTARVGDGVLVTAAEVAAATGSKLKAPKPPQNTGVGTDNGILPPSAGGVGGSYEPALDYDGNLQPGVPGTVVISVDSASEKFNNAQDHINAFTSPGLVVGGDFSAAANTLTIAEGTVVLRVGDDLSSVKFFDFDEATIVIPEDHSTHFIGLDYNGGSPVIEYSRARLYSMNRPRSHSVQP